MTTTDFFGDIELVGNQIHSTAYKPAIGRLLPLEAKLGAACSQVESMKVVTVCIEKAVLRSTKADAIIELRLRDAATASVVDHEVGRFFNSFNDDRLILVIGNLVSYSETDPLEWRIVAGVLSQFAGGGKQEADFISIDLNQGAQSQFWFRFANPALTLCVCIAHLKSVLP